MAASAFAQANLQHVLQSAMAGQSGAAVVLDVASGGMLAHYRLDLAAHRLASPGSAIKPFTLLSLLHSGRFNPDERFFCHRKLQLASRGMDCTHPEVSSGFDAADALAYSCNSYFATFAAHLTAQDLREEFQQAGLLSPTGLAPSEAVGSVRTLESQERIQMLALGEDEIEVTPLELLAAYRRLALRQKSGDADTAFHVVSQGLQGSVEYGMAHAAQTPNLAVAGKTGTARSLTSPRPHGWFAGYAPAENPEIVLVVYLEEGRGSSAAALARQVFAAYQQGKDAR